MTPDKDMGTGTGRGRPTAVARLALLFAILALTGSLVRGLARLQAPAEPLPAGLLAAALPDAVRFEERSEPLPHLMGWDSGGGVAGAVVTTDTIPPVVRGYLGQIGTAVGLTPEGRITAVIPFRHTETPYYMEMVTGSGLIQEMTGIDLTKPFPFLDAVSGATVSSRALIGDVRRSSSLAASRLFGIDVPPPRGGETSPWTHWKTILLAALLAASLAVGALSTRAGLREAMMLLNLAGIGFILNTPVTLSAISRILTLDLPGPENPTLLLILAYLAASVPWQGRSYCRLVCPFGAIQHLGHRLWPWKARIDPGIAPSLPVLRHVLLGGLLILGVWVGFSGFTEVEPFFGLFSLRLTPVLWITASFVLAVSLFWRRFWCNGLCPTGTILSILSRAVRPRKGRDDETV
ncbi:MAG: 4Fe-4S binding protein [bacterium]|nr:MAG: 4Fe-4S binding protein [bacterium]